MARIPIGESLNGPWPGMENPFKVQQIEPLVLGIVTWGLIIAGITTMVCIAWSAVQWISSGGDKGAIQAARSRLTSCLVGLTIVATALAVMTAVQYFLGIEVF